MYIQNCFVRKRIKIKKYIYLLAFLRFRSFSSAVIPCNDFSDDDVDGLIDEDCAKPAPSKCIYQYIYKRDIQGDFFISLYSYFSVSPL